MSDTIRTGDGQVIAVIGETLTPGQLAGLQALREPLPAESISKKPVDIIDKQGNDYVDCAECGKRHKRARTHLDYAGHAAVTQRLLEVDPCWNWEPLAYTPFGLPLVGDDGMWIRLTICGVTRLGFGDAEGKRGPNAVKEMIGDGIRNGAMRFGVGLELWHRGTLGDHDALPEAPDPDAVGRTVQRCIASIEKAQTVPALTAIREYAEGFGILATLVDEPQGITVADLIDQRERALTEAAAQ